MGQEQVSNLPLSFLRWKSGIRFQGERKDMKHAQEAHSREVLRLVSGPCRVRSLGLWGCEEVEERASG